MKKIKKMKKRRMRTSPMMKKMIMITTRLFPGREKAITIFLPKRVWEMQKASGSSSGEIM
ncbi:MAG: hypothetical protein EPN37_16900 [Chitinophagaceae bacterium]|nr:MAG: hypothetical protein EPN37_16900 [Chitinophagaceae bacterium]